MSMEQVEVLLGSDFSVTSPNFGDGEVRSIEFSHPNVLLRLCAMPDFKLFSIEMLNVEFFHFETDHPQNVVDRLCIYPDRTAYVAGSPKGVILPEPEKLEALLRKVVVIRPVAGPAMTCVCKDVKIRFV